MKKNWISLAGLALIIGVVSCSETKDRYVDLRTGEPVELVKDETSGRMVVASTREPVYIYVDTKTHDTIYGRTGEVINGHVVRNNSNEYVYDKDGDEYKVKDGDYKKKVEKDGDIKIKDGDTKIKIDGETGEKKVKHDD